VTGSVTAEGGVWTANHLEGYRATFSSLNPAPWAGRYTIVYPGAHGGAASMPGGDGYGVLSVSGSGTVSMNGKMGDGTSFSQAVSLSPVGKWPFYAPLYSGHGSALGWLKFSGPTNSLALADTNRPLSWIKPAIPGRLYPGGFSMPLSPLACVYTPPSPGNPLYPNEIVAGQLTFMDGNLSQDQAYSGTFAQDNTVLVGAVPFLRLSSPSTGLMSGSFFHQNLSLNRSVWGVVLQDRRTVGGFFIGGDQTGSALFQP
jgi:hypothetical protein